MSKTTEIKELSHLISQLSDGCLLVSPETDKIILCNESIEDITGYSTSRLYKMSMTELLEKLNIDEISDDIRDFEGKFLKKQVKFRNKNNETREVELVISHTNLETKQFLLVIFKPSYHEIKYERITSVVKSIREAEKLLNNSYQFDLSELTKNFCEILKISEEMIWIGILDFDNLNIIQPIASASVVGQIFDDIDDLEIHRDNIVTVLEYGEPMVIQDIDQKNDSSIWTIIADELDLKSVLLLPLTTNELTYGIISLFSLEKSSYSDEIIEMYSDLATDLSEIIVDHLFDDKKNRMEMDYNNIRQLLHDTNNLMTKLQSKILKLVPDKTDPSIDQITEFMVSFSDHIEMIKEGKYTPYFSDELDKDLTTSIDPSKETIMIVDDDKGSRELIRAIVSKLDYNIIEAVDGEEAIELLANIETTVPLIISDIMMPKFSGLELAEKVHVDNPDQQFCFISGYQISPFVQDKLENSNSPFLAKPFKPDQLLDLVREILE